MAPLVEAFHPSQLQDRAQYDASGKMRKPPIDLKECELKEIIQYDCNLAGPKEDPKSKVICEEIVRLFRRCADGLTVETTSWEHIHNK